jgi:hypothetical protein
VSRVANPRQGYEKSHLNRVGLKIIRNPMKKKSLLLIAIPSIIFLLHFFLVSVNCNIYVGSTSISRGIDATISLNNRIIFDDTIYYVPYGYKNINVNLKQGFNKISIESNKADFQAEQTIFFLIGQFIVIEYYGPVELIRDKPDFTIHKRFGSFYYE